MKIPSYNKLLLVPYLVALGALLAQTSCAQPAYCQDSLAGGAEQEEGPANILFVLDASYSMKEKLSGEMKMTAAKEVLQNALTRIPNNVNIGLRVFGQNYSNLAQIDCQQTALLVPIGQHNRGAIIKSIRQIEPYGMTPIMYALRLAAEDDFRGIVGPKTVILITDGADTCGGDPCAYLNLLRARGIRMKVDVVGVDLAREKAAREQLKCITAISLGKYYEANSSTQLIDGIGRSVDQAISGRVLPREKPSQSKSTAPEQKPAESPSSAPEQKPAESPSSAPEQKPTNP